MNQLSQNQCNNSNENIHQNEMTKLKVSMDILKKENEELKLKVEKLEKERDSESNKILHCESEKKICLEEIVSKAKIISELESGSAEDIITKQELHDCEEELENEIRKIINLQTTALTNRRRAQEFQNKLEVEIEAKEKLQQRFESFHPSWGEWSACSKNCGGVKTRMDKCSFENIETEPCNENCSKSGKSVYSCFSDLIFIFSIGHG